MTFVIELTDSSTEGIGRCGEQNFGVALRVRPREGDVSTEFLVGKKADGSPSRKLSTWNI